MHTVESILIANRGEIAVRVIRAARDLGIRTIAIYSELDRDAVHTAMADEAWNVGTAPAADSYLNRVIYNLVELLDRIPLEHYKFTDSLLISP